MEDIDYAISKNSRRASAAQSSKSKRGSMSQKRPSFATGGYAAGIMDLHAPKQDPRVTLPSIKSEAIIKTGKRKPIGRNTAQNVSPKQNRGMSMSIGTPRKLSTLPSRGFVQQPFRSDRYSSMTGTFNPLFRVWCNTQLNLFLQYCDMLLLCYLAPLVPIVRSRNAIRPRGQTNC